MITDIIRKLRRTADILENLWMTSDPLSEPKIARAIAKRIGPNLDPSARRGRPPGQGKSYNGTHWKQRAKQEPEPVTYIAIDGLPDRIPGTLTHGEPAIVGRPPAERPPVPKPPHWTQRPENKARLAANARKQWKAGVHDSQKTFPPAKTSAPEPVEPPIPKRHYAHGTHWTQRPENKAKVAKIARKGRRTFLKKQHAQKTP